MDRWTGRWMNGWMDRQTYLYIAKQTTHFSSLFTRDDITKHRVLYSTYVTQYSKGCKQVSWNDGLFGQVRVLRDTVPGVWSDLHEDQT